MRNVKPNIPANEAVYTLRVKRAQLARIHEIAASEYRTLSAKLRLMIDAEIAEHDRMQNGDADPAPAVAAGNGEAT